jgi:predicted lipoprotein with Yx(FWY)xxD motif
MKSRGTLFAALVASLVLLLAACSSGTGASVAPSAPAATPSPVESMAPASEAPTEEPSESASAEAEVELKVVDGGADLGQYLVGENDLTLYIFTNDTEGDGKSVCNGDCATAWPPLLADSADAVELDDGVTGEVTIITRDDGDSQVAYNGMPLYYFQGDTAAGQTNGQGLNDVWFVAEP